MKNPLRKEKLTMRSSLSPSFVRESSEAFFKAVRELEEYRNAHSVMSYSSFRNEAGTEMINEMISVDNKELILPVTGSDFMITAYTVTSPSDLKKSSMGIMEPDTEKCMKADLSVIDLIIVPGVAFDFSGNRIGFGRGCYDTFLSKLGNSCTTAALAYEFQLVDRIPAEDHDIPMDIIITEKRVIRIR